MRYCYFVLSILFFISCNNRPKNKELNSSSDGLALAIQGTWGGFETPTWDIGSDSIFYYSENKSYYYFIHGNDLIVLYKNGPYKFKNIQMVNDTAFCEIDNMNVKFFRWKSNKSSRQHLGSGKDKFEDEIPIDTAEFKKSILGEWGYQHSKGLFSWIITKDSVNYLQIQKTFYYKQNENNIIVLADEKPVLMKDIAIKNDTMFFMTQDSVLIKAHKIH